MKYLLKFFLISTCFLSTSAFAGSASHSDPIASVILGVTTILFLALIGRYLAKKFNQPVVLGELMIGVLIGNILYWGGSNLIVILREGSSIYDIVNLMLSGTPLAQAVSSIVPNSFYGDQLTQALSANHGTEFLKIAYIVDIFSRFGVILLLFLVGLETSVDELKHTGRESTFVAIIGVIVPMLSGFVVAYLLLPNSTIQTDLFVGATLSATSVGITARVLRELKQLGTREAKTILGAAMLDDVLGLILLAIVSSVVLSGSVDVWVVGKIIFYSILFFAGVLLLGPFILKRAVAFFHFLEPWEAKLFISFLFVMALSWLASSAQLAAIVGAFAAGVILRDSYFKPLDPHQTEKRSIHHLISPLESLLAPIFFISIGMQVKLETFFSWNVIFLASGLLIAAVIGKLVSGFGAKAKDDRLLIGIGMLPRGEVGLIFASIGRTLGVISDDLFSAIVFMVMLTTLMAPPLLKARLMKRKLSHDT